MSKILASGKITTGLVRTVLVPDKFTGRFGLMLNGNFDSGLFFLLFGIEANRQLVGILNPEAGLISGQAYGSNGTYYIECFAELVDLRITGGLGLEDVDYVLFIGDRP